MMSVNPNAEISGLEILGVSLDPFYHYVIFYHCIHVNVVSKLIATLSGVFINHCTSNNKATSIS